MFNGIQYGCLPLPIQNYILKIGLIHPVAAIFKNAMPPPCVYSLYEESFYYHFFYSIKIIMKNVLDYCDSIGEDSRELEKNIKRLMNIFQEDDFEKLSLYIQDTGTLIELLLDKYTLTTTINIMKSITPIFHFYRADAGFVRLFKEELYNLIDLRDNKKLYSTESIFIIRDTMKNKVNKLISGNICFTYLRNFLVIYLFIFYFPIRLTHWANIKLEYDDYSKLQDFDEEPIYLVVQQNEFYFIFNKYIQGIFKGQYIHKIEEKNTFALLRKYLSEGRRRKTFLTNKSGKPITATNLSNGITNFTKENFNKTISINNLRIQYSKYCDKLFSLEQLPIKNLLFNF